MTGQRFCAYLLRVIAALHARRHRAGSLSSDRNDIGERCVTPYRVIVEWEEDARVWVASSEDVSGLANRCGYVRGLNWKAEDRNSRTAGGERLLRAQEW